MSTSIEQRVVQMKFDNQQFEKGAAQSIQTLDKFQEKLKFKEAGEGLNEISKAASKVSLQPMVDEADNTGKKFDALAVVAVSALNRITNAAITAGTNLIKSVSVDQVTAGWSKYEQKTASVQTIMNSTGKTIDEVNGYLDKLMWFSDETSYGFNDMVSSISQLTNAGGDIDKLVPMVMGIANATAFAGKGVTEFSRAIYNLNQSYSSGYLQYMDWRSLELAGVASKQLKEVFIATAEEMGKIEKGSITIANFSETLKDKWADTSVMEAAFSKFSAMSEKAYEMVESGLVDTASEAYELLSDQYTDFSITAAKAAQEAKSFTEAVDATKDAVSSGWMKTFEIIFGNYEEATKLWTDLANTLWDVFASGATERNEMVQAWKDLGGRAALLNTITKMFKTLSSVIGTLKKGFEEMFPPVTAQTLFDITLAIKDFVYSLQPSEEALLTLKVIFKALLLPVNAFVQVLRIGMAVVSGFIKVIFTLVDSLLALPALIGTINDPFKKLFGNTRYTRITKAFSKIISSLGSGLGKIKDVIVSLLPSTEQTSGVFSTLGSILGEFGSWILDRVVDGFELLAKIDFSKFGSIIAKGIEAGSKAFSSFIKLIKEGFSNFSGLVSKAKDGIVEFFSKFSISSPIDILTNIVSAVKNFIGYIQELVSNFLDFDKAFSFTDALGPAGKALENFKDVIFKVADAVRSFVEDLKPSRILIFAFGIAIIALVASITKAIATLTESVKGVLDATKNILTSGNKILTSISSSINKVVTKINVSTIVQIASAIVLLSVALIALAKTDSDKLIEAAGALAILIGSFTVMLTAMGLINKFLIATPEMAKNMQMFATVALAMSGSVAILAASLLILDKVDLNGFGKKLLAMAGVLATLVIAVRLTGKSAASSLSQASTILAFATAMALIAFTLAKISEADISMSLSTALSFITVIAALKLLSGSITKIKFSGALGLLTMVISLGLIASQLKKLAEYDTADLLLGLMNFIPIFGVLVALRLLMNGKEASNLGTQFIGIAAGLFVLYLAIKKIGSMDTSVIIKGGLCVSALLVVFGIMQALANIGSKNGKMKGSFISMSLAILILSLAIDYLGSLDLKAVVQGGIVVAAMLALMALLASQLGSANKSTGTVIAIIAALGLMVTAIMLLTLIDDWKSLAASVAALSATMIAFGATIKLISDFKVASAIGATALLVVLIATITYALKTLNKFDWNTSLASATALAEVMLAFAGFTKIFKALDAGNVANWVTTAIALVAVLAISVAGIAALNALNIDSGILEKTAALSLLMIALAGISVIMSKFKVGVKSSADSAGGLVIFIGILVAFLTALGAIMNIQVGDQPLSAFLESGIPIINNLYKIVPAIAVVGLIAGVFSKFKIDIDSAASAATAISAFAGILVAFLTALGLVMNVQVNDQPLSVFLESGIPIINSLYKIVPAIAVIGVVAGVFSKFKIDIASAASAATSIAVFIAILGVVLTAIGGLFTIGNLEEYLDKAIVVLPKIGQAIGGFIGGLGAGIIGGAAAGLAAGLSAFMTNLEPFFEGLDGVNADKVNAVANLGDMLLAITKAEWINSITMFVGDDPLKKFGEQLADFGPKFAEFADSIADIDEEKVTVCTAALSAFAGIIDAVGADVEIGWGLFSSKTDWSGFGEGMKSFAEGFNTFAQTIDTSVLDADMVDKTSYAMQALTDMADNIPRSGGALQAFFGEKDMGTFGEQMNSFATSLMEFFKKISGQDPEIGEVTLDADLVTKAAKASKALADFDSNIPRSGGHLQSFFGEKDMGTFGEQLVSFGTSMVAFFRIINGEDPEVGAVTIDTGLADKVKTVGESFAKLAEAVPPTGGYWQAFVGSVDLGTFGDQIGNFGVGMASFFQAMKDTKVTIGDVNIAKYAGETFTSLTESLDPNEGIFNFWQDGVDLSEYGDDIKLFGEGLAGFYESIKDINFETWDHAISTITQLTDLNTSLKDIDPTGGYNFNLYLSNLAGITLTDFSDELANGVDDLTDAVAGTLDQALEAAANKVTPETLDFSGIVDCVVDTVWLGKTRIEAAGRLMTYWIKAGFESQYEFLKNSGGYLVSSILAGVKDKLDDVEDDFEKVCDKVLSTVNDEFDIANESSAEFEKIGKYCIEGFIKGFKSEANDSLDTIRSVGASIVTATEESTGVNSPSVKFAEIGKYCMLGLSNGLKDYSEGTISVAVKMGENIVQAMKDYLEIESPSKVTRDEVGRYIMEGIAEGIESDTSAEDAAAQKAQNIVSAFQEEFDKLSTSLETVNLEYELWSNTNPNATVGESNLKQIELLDAQMKNQAERVNAANAQYKITLEALGESADETTEAYNAYLQEKVSLSEMANQLVTLQQNNVTAFSEFATVYAENIEGLQRFGFSQEEIKEFSKQQTGWVDPSTFTKTGSISDIMEQYLAETTAGTSDVQYAIVEPVVAAVTTARTISSQGGTAAASDFNDSFTDTLLNMDADDIDISTLKDTILNSLPSKEDALESGGNLISGLDEGITKASEWLTKTGGSISNVATNALNSLNDWLGEHSPSVYTEESGINLIRGLENGISNAKANASLIDAIGIVSNKTLKTFNESIPEYKNVGLEMDAGLAQGIREGKSEAINAAVEVAVAALEAAKSALGVASPSRKFYEIGEMIDQGLSNGILDEYSIVDGSISKIVNRVADLSEDDLIVKMVVDDSDVKEKTKALEDQARTLWWTGDTLESSQLSPYAYTANALINYGRGKWLTVDTETFNAVQSLYDHANGSSTMWTPRTDLTAGEQKALAEIFSNAISTTVESLTANDIATNFGRGDYSSTSGGYVNITQNITSPTPADPAEIARQTGNVLGQLSSSASSTIHNP